MPPLHDDATRRTFVAEQYQGLYRWLWWLTGSADVAADLTQDSFAAFWTSLDRVAVRHPRVWLYTIARNRWRKWCRDERPAPADDAAARLADLVDAAARAEREEMVRRVVDAVGALPSAYREALTLRYWGGLSARDVGRVLGVNAPLARWRVHQALRMLREAVGANAEIPGDHS